MPGAYGSELGLLLVRRPVVVGRRRGRVAESGGGGGAGRGGRLGDRGSCAGGSGAGGGGGTAAGLRTRRGRLRAACLAGALGRPHDRARDLADRVLAETGGGEQLLGAVLGTGEHGARLRARPFERLLDLGAGGVRELGRLVARLLEQAAALGLGLLQLARRVGMGLREELARLVPRGVQHLRALALALLAVALDLGLALLQVVLAAADLFLGLRELRGRRRSARRARSCRRIPPQRG